ncbi:hypothetical protein LJC15_02020, partial [Desulfovibrio sp. OttesenSCG-928-G11]|nr:hypothetical protein [Desulfovibrio sp. OttesenSCG-928-G11]
KKAIGRGRFARPSLFADISVKLRNFVDIRVEIHARRLQNEEVCIYVAFLPVGAFFAGTAAGVACAGNGLVRRRPA